jgi:hypothetical protein
MFCGEVICKVVGIYYFEEKININGIFFADLPDTSFAKSQVNAKTINNLKQMVIQMNYFGHFHICMYLHDPAS